jgi:hypothetical protein
VGKHFPDDFNEALGDDLTVDRKLALTFYVGMALLAAESLLLILGAIYGG